MRRALASDHQAAVARRLELLSAELATVRGDSPPTPRLRVAGPAETDDDDLGASHWRPGGPTVVRAVASDEPGASPGAVLPRLPGRHASRRRVSWGALVPESLTGRWALGPGQVAVLALAAAL